jgi:hypothetical protein
MSHTESPKNLSMYTGKQSEEGPVVRMLVWMIVARLSGPNLQYKL